MRKTHFNKGSIIVTDHHDLMMTELTKVWQPHGSMCGLGRTLLWQAQSRPALTPLMIIIIFVMIMIILPILMMTVMILIMMVVMRHILWQQLIIIIVIMTMMTMMRKTMMMRQSQPASILRQFSENLAWEKFVTDVDNFSILLCDGIIGFAALYWQNMKAKVWKKKYGRKNACFW